MLNDIGDRITVVHRAKHHPDYRVYNNDANAAFLAKAFVLKNFLTATDSMLDKVGEGTPWDFKLNGKTVRVKWSPRVDARLIQYVAHVVPCDIYILVTGSYEFTMRGWAKGEELLRFENVMLLRYDLPAVYALPQYELHPMEELYGGKEEGEAGTQ